MTITTVNFRLIDDIAHSLFSLRDYHISTVPSWFVANHDLWGLCADAMGAKWCADFDTASECAAMILALYLLKQIKIEGES